MRKFDRQGRGTIAFDDFIQACVTVQVRMNPEPEQQFGLNLSNNHYDS